MTSALCSRRKNNGSSWAEGVGCSRWVLERMEQEAGQSLLAEHLKLYQSIPIVYASLAGKVWQTALHHGRIQRKSYRNVHEDLSVRRLRMTEEYEAQETSRADGGRHDAR